MRTPLRGLDNHELQLCYTCPAGVFLVGRPHPFEFLCLGSRSVHRYVVRLLRVVLISDGEKAGQRARMYDVCGMTCYPCARKRYRSFGQAASLPVARGRRCGCGACGPGAWPGGGGSRYLRERRTHTESEREKNRINRAQTPANQRDSRYATCNQIYELSPYR